MNIDTTTAIFDGFENLEDVFRSWTGSQKGLDVEGTKLVYAQYDVFDYEGSAYCIFERGGDLFEASCSHCSCNGLDDFTPAKVTAEAMLKFTRYKEPAAITEYLTRRRGMERLLKLASLLEGLDPEKFKFSIWASMSGALPGKNPIECGTTACALGWATAIPECGIELRTIKHETFNVHGSSNFTVCLSDTPAGEDLSHQVHPELASKAAFDLSVREHDYLFIPSDDYDDYYEGDEDEQRGDDGKPVPWATAKIVALHIREFVEAGGIPE